MRTSQDICLPERDSGHFIAKLRLMTIASESVGERLYVLTQVALKQNARLPKRKPALTLHKLWAARSSLLALAACRRHVLRSCRAVCRSFVTPRADLLAGQVDSASAAKSSVGTSFGRKPQHQVVPEVCFLYRSCERLQINLYDSTSSQSEGSQLFARALRGTAAERRLVRLARCRRSLRTQVCRCRLRQLALTCYRLAASFAANKQNGNNDDT